MDATDYFEIQNLIYRYAHLLDSGRIEEVGRLFEDAFVYMPGDAEPWSCPGRNRMGEILGSWTRVFPETGTPRTRHVTTNLMIEPQEDGTVRTRSYVVVFQATPDLPLQPIIAGSYIDRLEKRDGTWRFVERREEMPLVGELREHLLQAFAPA